MKPQQRTSTDYYIKKEEEKKAAANAELCSNHYAESTGRDSDNSR